MNSLNNHESQKQNRQVLIVTGLSGAGKTSVMRALEDLGFYCVDNLPVPLLSTFLKLAFHTQTNLNKVALGIDARGEQFFSHLLSEIDQLKQSDMHAKPKIIFLAARANTILKRFQETRRKHPLGEDISLEQAIQKERLLLEPIMAMADVILETDNVNVHELRDVVRRSFSNEDSRELTVNLVSFGFKYGVPPESNQVYDLRFLPNPYFMPALKAFDGRKQEIHDFLFTQDPVIDYWKRLRGFLDYSLQKFYEEGRFFVTVAIGCTGGKHRSVAFVEKICKEKLNHIKFLPNHRDVEKE